MTDNLGAVTGNGDSGGASSRRGENGQPSQCRWRRPPSTSRVGVATAVDEHHPSVVSLKSLGGWVRDTVVCELPAWDCWTGTVNG